jgi:hypothetical protein
MKINFENIDGKHSKEECIICCHGPSLNSILNNIRKIKEKNIKIFGCNNWFHFYETVPDYWVLCSSVDTLQRHLHKINESGSITIFSKSADETWEKYENFLTVDYLPYCHWNRGKKEGEKTIGEFLKDKFNTFELLEGGDTVAVQMLAFAVLMGFKKIYLSGMDLNYRIGYAKNKANLRPEKHNILDQYIPRIRHHVDIIRSAAEKQGIRIINLSLSNLNGIEKGVINI